MCQDALIHQQNSDRIVTEKTEEWKGGCGRFSLNIQKGPLRISQLVSKALGLPGGSGDVYAVHSSGPLPWGVTVTSVTAYVLLLWEEKGRRGCGFMAPEPERSPSTN